MPAATAFACALRCQELEGERLQDAGRLTDVTMQLSNLKETHITAVVSVLVVCVRYHNKHVLQGPRVTATPAQAYTEH